LALLLFHSAWDADLQVRRMYGVLGFLWLAAGIVGSLIWTTDANGKVLFGSYFLPYGFTCLTLALLFLMSFTRNETEPAWRKTLIGVLGGVGLALALAGFVGGNISESFLLPYGLVLTVLGLFYLWAFVGLQGPDSDLGYRAGAALGVLGLLAILFALGRSVLPPLFFSWRWLNTRPDSYFVPSGLILLSLGLAYAGLSAALCSDNRTVVLFRRELAALFYSPLAYIVLFSFAVISWWFFWQFVANLYRTVDMRMASPEDIMEPIITRYLLAWFPVICVIITVPVLSMRLLSEEHRTGTLEVLLTAPVGEWTVVLSKFLAALVFYLMIWAPWGLCLLALRVEGGQPFEYRPLLSFYLMTACTGAAFLSMGLFFSSLTRSQIAAAVLTFMGMLLLTAMYFAKELLAQSQPTGASPWVAVATHISYLDLWITSLLGEITPKFYVFPISVTVLWLFLTSKVLESRKWC